MTRSMNLQSVRTLLLSAELGSFSAASERLGVPPSTVSRRVSELEDALGCKLLVRTGRGVRPADDAVGTLTRLADVLHAVEACYAPPPGLAQLRVTAPLEMGLTLLPELLPAYRAEFPDVFVEIRGENRMVGLVEGNFDLAIRAGPLDDSSYQFRKLPRNRFVVVAAPTLALACTSLQMLATTPVVEIAGLSPIISGRWEGNPFSLQPPTAAKLETFTAALPLVLASQTIAVMPLRLVRDYLRRGDLRAVDQVDLDDVPLHALGPARHRGQPAVMALIDAIAAALHDVPSEF